MGGHGPPKYATGQTLLLVFVDFVVHFCWCFFGCEILNSFVKFQPTSGRSVEVWRRWLEGCTSVTIRRQTTVCRSAWSWRGAYEHRNAPLLLDTSWNYRRLIWRLGVNNDMSYYISLAMISACSLLQSYFVTLLWRTTSLRRFEVAFPAVLNPI